MGPHIEGRSPRPGRAGLAHGARSARRTPAASALALLGACLAAGAPAPSWAEPLYGEAGQVARACPELDSGFIRLPGTEVCLRLGGVVLVESRIDLAGKALQVSTDYDGDEPRVSYAAADLDAPALKGIDTQGDLIVEVVSDSDLGPVLAVLHLRGRVPDGEAMELGTAFVAVGGVSAGLRGSFFDFGSGFTETEGYAPDASTNLVAFTYEAAPGLSLTASLEDGGLRRFDDGVWSQPAGQRMPDVVAAADFEAEWGSAHAAAALRELRDVRSPDEREWGWAATAGAEYRFVYPNGTPARLLVSGAYASGALGYLGIPFFATDYILDADGRIRPTRGYSALVSYEHDWTPSLRSAATASLYRANSTAGSLDWQADGFLLTLGTEYMAAEGLTAGAELSYLRDSAEAVFPDAESGRETAEAVNGLLYMRRIF